MRFSGRGRLSNAWVGSPKDVADMLEEWFTAPACDGFVIGPTHLPGAFEEFVLRPLSSTYEQFEATAARIAEAKALRSPSPYPS